MTQRIQFIGVSIVVVLSLLADGLLQSVVSR